MDDVITLVGAPAVEYDEYGNPITTPQLRELMCRIYGVTRSEFYSAATANLHPEVIVRLSDVADYQGEKAAVWNGVEYSIIRTYRDGGSFHDRTGMSPNEIELVLERKVGDGEQDSGSATGENPCCLC